MPTLNRFTARIAESPATDMADEFAVLSDGDVRRVIGGLRRHLRWALPAAVVAGVATGAYLQFRPARFEAPVVFATIENSRSSLPIPGAAASLLAGGLGLTPSGFQSTPAVVSYLLRSRTVLEPLIDSTFRGRSLGEAIVGRQLSHKTPRQRYEIVRDAIHTTVTKETGLVSMAIESRDSAAARALATSIIAVTQRTFAAVQQAQARQLRDAQTRRLDSAERELKDAENRLLAFNMSNRAVPAGTALALERDRRDRAVALAQQVYQAAVTEQQSAVARELETIPALAIVEPLPPEIDAVARHALLQGVLATVATFGVAMLAALCFEFFQQVIVAEPGGQTVT